MSCRLCLKSDSHLLHDIFNSELKCSDLSLLDTLYWIFDVRVHMSDPYSKFICVKCEDVIRYIGSCRTLYRRNQLVLQGKLEFSEDAVVNEQEYNCNWYATNILSKHGLQMNTSYMMDSFHINSSDEVSSIGSFSYDSNTESEYTFTCTNSKVENDFLKSGIRMKTKGNLMMHRKETRLVPSTSESSVKVSNNKAKKRKDKKNAQKLQKKTSENKKVSVDSANVSNAQSLLSNLSKESFNSPKPPKNYSQEKEENFVGDKNITSNSFDRLQDMNKWQGNLAATVRKIRDIKERLKNKNKNGGSSNIDKEENDVPKEFELETNHRDTFPRQEDTSLKPDRSRSMCTRRKSRDDKRKRRKNRELARNTFSNVRSDSNLTNIDPLLKQMECNIVKTITELEKVKSVEEVFEDGESYDLSPFRNTVKTRSDIDRFVRDCLPLLEEIENEQKSEEGVSRIPSQLYDSLFGNRSGSSESPTSEISDQMSASSEHACSGAKLKSRPNQLSYMEEEREHLTKKVEQLTSLLNLLRLLSNSMPKPAQEEDLQSIPTPGNLAMENCEYSESIRDFALQMKLGRKKLETNVSPRHFDDLPVSDKDFNRTMKVNSVSKSHDEVYNKSLLGQWKEQILPFIVPQSGENIESEREDMEQKSS